MAEFEQLAARERQIVEAVYRLEEGSVSDVLAAIADPPSYSAVRAMLTILVQKGYLASRKDKNRYLYRPAASKHVARKSVVRNMLNNFFGGKATDAMATLLDVAADELGDNDYKTLKTMINNARKESEGKS
jgi:predicted transcriptional regulator